MGRSVIFYTDSLGHSSVNEFIEELEEKSLTSKHYRLLSWQVYLHIEALEREGTWIGKPYVEFLDDKIWELKPGNFRILFCIDKNGDYILLHHFKKKTRKTSNRRIRKAKKEREEWNMRN